MAEHPLGTLISTMTGHTNQGEGSGLVARSAAPRLRQP